MANATITRLPPTAAPWAWSLRIHSAEPDMFEAVISSLKINVPSRYRKWEPAGKCWWLRTEHIDLVEGILQRYGMNYDFADDCTGRNANHQKTSIMTRQQAAAELFLLPTAPPDVITAVYRTLAKIHHPDHGGSTERMQKLNQAIEVLR